jgi:flagellar hook-basal body complex protein FliE
LSFSRPHPLLFVILAPFLQIPLHSAASVKKRAVEEVMSQGVEFNRLMLEMRAMQAEAMARQKPAVSEPVPGAPSFSEMLGQAVNKVNETQQVSNKLATAFEMGQSGVDLTDVMIASQKASVSFQAMTQVRNKLVQAYQDIMQMPV